MKRVIKRNPSICNKGIVRAKKKNRALGDGLLHKKYFVFSQAEVCNALRKTNGIVGRAAKLLNTTRATIYNYINEFPNVKACLHDARETIIDNAEHGLHVCVDNKEPWAIVYTLKSLGSKRGFGERRINESQVNELMRMLASIVIENVSDTATLQKILDGFKNAVHTNNLLSGNEQGNQEREGYFG